MVTTEIISGRCVHCAKLAPAGPICSECRRKLMHVCYGKVRHFKSTALSVQEREQVIPGRENTEAYPCPVCREWHTGRTSPGGKRMLADAVLICLKIMRFHADFLDGLALAWRPQEVDRMAWRAATAPRRYAEMTKGERDADTDACPA